MNLAEFIDGHRDQHLAELYEFLRIPSVSAKSEHKPAIERGARWVSDHLRAGGFKNIEIVPTGLHPLVYAESGSPRQAHHPFLRALRCAARRASQSMDVAAVRTHRAQRQSLWTRYRRRQGPDPHPPESARMLAAGERQTPHQCKDLDLRRRGSRQRQPLELRSK